MTSLIEYVVKGGVVMIPIGICSVVALAIIIERLIMLRRNQFIPDALHDEIRTGLLRNQIAEVMAVCYRSEISLARIVKAGVEHLEDSREEISTAMEATGKKEVDRMEKHLTLLATVANISPLLGLLGTVTGMIRVFNVITVEGVGNAQALSGGIAEALITTAAGLIVGIPTLLAHSFLSRRVGSFAIELESASQELLNLLAKQTRVSRR